jgi:hypothetical protein
VDLETSNAIDFLRQDLGQRITAVEDALRGEARGLREEMREMRGELMRQAMVLTDSIRDDIRVVAEGLAMVSAKLDALRR